MQEKEKPEVGKSAQAHPEVKAEKPEVKSEVERKNAEPVTQDKAEKKSDSVHHTEVTEPLDKQQEAEPAAQLNSKDNDQEAA